MKKYTHPAVAIFGNTEWDHFSPHASVDIMVWTKNGIFYQNPMRIKWTSMMLIH